jgi:glycosyltransferase involved in cell wall biosynthesis
LKILVISDAGRPQVNGVVRTYEYLEPELIKMGHAMHIIAPADFPHTFPMPGYNEIRLTLAPTRRLVKMIEDAKADAHHIATEGPLGKAARKYFLRHGIPFSTAYHTHFPHYIALRAPKIAAPLLQHLTMRYMRDFHAPSKAMMVATASLEDDLKNWNFTAPMHRLTRGVDFDRFRPDTKTLFNDIKRPIALYVGRVAVEKNLEAFLQMDWHGSKVIVGDGPSLESLKAKYPNAVFTGTKTGDDLAAHYRSADVFVFPSKTDTFGMVLVEAMASGLPIAAYNVTGPKDIITHRDLGCLHEDLATAAREALQYGSADERHTHARLHYSWAIPAQQFLAGA